MPKKKNDYFKKVYDNSAAYDRRNGHIYDIPFYFNYAKNVAGKTLELGCGTGRVTIPLAKAGVDISGLDISKPMLTLARKKARSEKIKSRWFLKDCRDFDLREKFDLIFIAYSMIGQLTSTDLDQILTQVKKHLSPDGIFIIDGFNPLCDQNHWVKKDPSVPRVQAAKTNRYKTLGEPFYLGNLYPAEFKHVLKKNGFCVDHFFGDFQSSKFCIASPVEIAVCSMKP